MSDKEIEIPDVAIGFVVGVDSKGGLAFKVIADPESKDTPRDLWTLLGISKIATKLVEGLVDEALSLGIPSMKKALIDVSRAQLEAYKGFSGAQLKSLETIIRKLMNETCCAEKQPQALPEKTPDAQ